MIRYNKKKTKASISVIHKQQNTQYKRIRQAESITPTIMLKILLILSVLSLSHISVGKLITHLNDSNIHPCERVNGTGNIWAANPRGCDLYFYCEKYPAFIGNGQCPEGFHFDEPHQACNDQSLVGCDIDENLWGAECEETGYSKVAHPYSCSEFTGENY